MVGAALTTTSGVQLSGGLLSLCSPCPALWEYKCRHRKKDYNLHPALPLICPPNNGLWFLRQPRLPWHTWLHVWLHWIPVPHICLHIANPSPLLGYDLRSLSSSTQPPPEPMDVHVRLGHAEGWYCLSVRYSLCSGCHKLATVPSFKVLKFPCCSG